MIITVKLSDLSHEEKDVLILMVVFGKVIDNTINHAGLMLLHSKQLVEQTDPIKFQDHTAYFWVLTQLGHMVAQGIPVSIDTAKE